MSRIKHCFDKISKKNKKALVPYIVCGDPLPEYTLSLMQALVKAGADMIELGVPFSDPMAEGPVIQKAHERALIHGTSLRDALTVVSQFRQSDLDTPVILMGYANPVERMGYKAFAEQASAAGVDGVLTVDMPPEEAEDFNGALKQTGIDNIFLLAPTTTPERARHICELATGYLYYVSLKGVTGAAHLDVEAVKDRIAGFRAYTSLPICVGFGIKDAQSAAEISRVADGVVVGSALVSTIEGAYADGLKVEQTADQLSKIICAMRKAIDQG